MSHRRKDQEPTHLQQEDRRVAEVMGTALFTVTPDTGVAAALRLAANKRVQHFLVIEDGSLTGIVCESDLHGARRGTMVSDCMTTPVLCISPDTTLGEAAGIMEENAVDCLPVITGRFLVGMITREALNHLDVADVRLPKEKSGGSDCVGCGSSWRVTRDVRSNFLPLCASCLGLGTSTARPRGN